MVFLGSTFCGGKNALDYTPTDVNNLNKVTIQNAIFDELHITKDTSYVYTLSIPQEWDFNTILHALFKGNLDAGNVDYTLDQVSVVRIKRRETGQYQWLTLFEIPINSHDDFNFVRYDNYARSDVDYEYALVPVLNLIEGNLNINTVKSEFEGVFIIEKDTSFSTILDIDFSSQRNKTANVVNTISSKYPYVIQNGENNYDNISLSATFIDYDYVENKWKKSGHVGESYRFNLNNFLNNGKVKILKMPFTGQMWMVQSIDAIAHAQNGHPERITTSMQFVEVGDANSPNDLYDNGFIDANV